MPSTVIDMSSSLSFFMDKMNPIDSHFRWTSIKKFVYLACAYSNSMFNFDIFSKVCHKVRIFDFFLLQILVGTTYMFMDFFIKLYTRRLDSARLINPLLRGVTYGLFLQTALCAILHAEYMADTVRFLVASLRAAPSWSKCIANQSNDSCMSSADVVFKCTYHDLNSSINIFETSAHYNYVKSFSYTDRSALSSRLFVIGLVWIFNFFFSTVTDETLIKIFKLAYMCSIFSTLVTVLFVFFSARNHSGSKAFQEILNASADHSYVTTLEHLSYIYGIGYLGLYDFGTMSPFTMVDNSVIIFTLIFTTMAFVRSWIVRVLFLELANCVKIQENITLHYLVFAVLPLSTEFLHAHKLYICYIYVNIAVATTAYLAMLTLTMAKVLQAEFRSVKQLYLVGLLCFLGFGMSIPFTLSSATSLGLITGMNVVALYLGAIKVALVMWVYGVQRFATDIHFWLGFKPTRFWTISWMLLPIVLWGFLTRKIYLLIQLQNLDQTGSAVTWIAFAILFVTISQIKTIAKYLFLNNIAGIFSSSVKYGAPDADDRRRRKYFDETIQLRQCKHNCHAFDEMVDCNHWPLMQTSKSKISQDESTTSLTNIYEATNQSKLHRTFTTDSVSHL